jgi:hypothetical protein
LQTIKRVYFVLFLGAVLLGFDDNDAVLSDAIVAQVEQAFFVKGRQGRGRDIKAQVNGSGNFVHVLSPCPLEANRADLNFLKGRVVRWLILSLILTEQSPSYLVPLLWGKVRPSG